VACWFTAVGVAVHLKTVPQLLLPESRICNSPQKTTKSQGMNRIHRKYLPILLLLLLWMACSFSSCIRLMAERRTTVQSGAIPAEFGQHPGTLLVVKGKGGYNTYLRTNFTAFEGKYALVDSAELKKPEYADLQAYPYCFNFDAETHKTTGSDGKPRELHVRRFLHSRPGDQHALSGQDDAYSLFEDHEGLYREFERADLGGLVISSPLCHLEPPLSCRAECAPLSCRAESSPLSVERNPQGA
jgi:hypothetical protein